MDWSEETWVKLYTRETATMAMMPWETRAVLHELMKRVGFDGVVPLGRHGLRGLASLLRMPENVVRDAAADLAAEGVLAIADGETSLLLVNFYDAQKARTSDKERKRRSRDSKAAEAKATAGVVTPGHSTSQEVTIRLEETREEETRPDPPNPPAGGDGFEDESLWCRDEHDDQRRGEYLQLLWQAFGETHPTPLNSDELRLAKKLHEFLAPRPPSERRQRCDAIAAWLRHPNHERHNKLRLLVTGDWGEALRPQAGGVAPPAPHDQHGQGEVGF